MMTIDKLSLNHKTFDALEKLASEYQDRANSIRVVLKLASLSNIEDGDKAEAVLKHVRKLKKKAKKKRYWKDPNFVHWTQKPENKNKLRKLSRKMHKMRAAKYPKIYK